MYRAWLYIIINKSMTKTLLEYLLQQNKLMPIHILLVNGHQQSPSSLIRLPKILLPFWFW